MFNEQGPFSLYEQTFISSMSRVHLHKAEPLQAVGLSEARLTSP